MLNLLNQFLFAGLPILPDALQDKEWIRVINLFDEGRQRFGEYISRRANGSISGLAGLGVVAEGVGIQAR